MVWARRCSSPRSSRPRWAPPSTRTSCAHREDPAPFDRELADTLPAIQRVLPPDAFTPETIPRLRGGGVAVPCPSIEELRRGGAFEVEERRVAGPAGEPEISLLICRPVDGSAPTAGIYHIHGGGMVTGHNGNKMLFLLDWAQELGLVVISVEYRLAPETPHPGPVVDCYAGLVWTADNAGELGLDPGRIVTAGASAGGGLTAAVGLLARDRGAPFPWRRC